MGGDVFFCSSNNGPSELVDEQNKNKRRSLYIKREEILGARHCAWASGSLDAALRILRRRERKFDEQKKGRSLCSGLSCNVVEYYFTVLANENFNDFDSVDCDLEVCFFSEKNNNKGTPCNIKIIPFIVLAKQFYIKKKKRI